MPNVPQDIPVPHTLVLDLEQTLVTATWTRKNGWKYAKRPGVDKFLQELAQYYEIVLYSPSSEYTADPVVAALDKTGCIMHRLYRESNQFYNGLYVKPLDRLNRNVKRMIVLDDDPEAVPFHPENLVRIKPYTDGSNREDNSLERILPFLVEIAREGYSDIPELLKQYEGMDADGIADEQDRRLQQLRDARIQQTQGGTLGGFAARGASLPAPELAPSNDGGYGGGSSQLTAKEIAGTVPIGGMIADASDDSLMGWMNRRSQEKEEDKRRKMEKWNEVMMKKEKERQEAAAA